MAQNETRINMGMAPTLETLDEPVSTTILRDVKLVGYKLSLVILPRKSITALRDWDLWGPLMLCLILAILLSLSAPAEQTALIFAAVFVLVWCGAAVVTVNAVLLGGNISFFQSVCVLGYCVFPLVAAAGFVKIFNHVIFRSLLVLGAWGWSTGASVGFLAALVPAHRKILAAYPVFLFYLMIGWMILVGG